MHKSFIKRIVFSFIMLFVTAITLVSSTFAWFASNREAWTDEFDLEIQNTDSLLISVDGKNFRSSIPNDLLKKAIVAKAMKVDVDNITLTDDYVSSIFKDMALKSVTTSDLETFKAINENTIFAVDDVYELVDAQRFDYITFDLWFKVASSTSKADKKYDIKFVSDEYALNNNTVTSYVTCKDSVVKLHNKLTSTDKTYQSEETITLNSRDAIRIGVIHDDGQKTIYEPYAGVGSYALANDLEDIYNPSKNAMLTYFNNIHEAKLEPLASDHDIYKGTEKDFNGEISFGQVVPNADGTDYVPIKITVSVWLEGFDADYIIGISNTSFKMMFNFCMEEIKEGN